MLQSKSPPHLVTLIALTAVSTLALNMFLPSLANIAVDLQADYALVSLSIAGYLAITAVIQLIVGPLSDRLGRRPVLLAALALFTGASLICALAEDVWIFLIFRMLQGGMISGYVISLAIVRDTTEEQRTASLIGYISMAMAIAPMLGPMLGGVLDSAFGWRANFYAYALCGVALLVWCWFDLGETAPKVGEGEVSAQEGLRDLLGERAFWLFSLCSAFSTSAFYIFLTGAPLVAEVQFGVSPAQLGFLIGTITAGFMFGSFLAARFATRAELGKIIVWGRVCACLGPLTGLVWMTMADASIWVFFGSTIFVGFGNGLTIPSSNARAISIRPRLAGAAAGVNGALVVALGALLSTLTGFALPDDNPANLLLMLMLAASFAGLLAYLALPRNARQRQN